MFFFLRSLIVLKVSRAPEFDPVTWPRPLRSLNGRAVGGVNGFGYGSCGDCLVGHWHLARTLAEEPPVGRPVFALHGAAEAERVVRGQRGAARALGQGQRPAEGPPMVRVGERRRRPLPWEEGGHSEARGQVGLHAADVQRRDLDRGAGDLLVGQVLVQKTVHTPVHLFQIHLLVLEEQGGGRQRGEGHRG